MNIFKTVAITATLIAGTAAAYASPFDTMTRGNLGAIDNADYASVLTVNSGAAYKLKFENDPVSVQSRINNNPALSRTILDQGFDIDQVVGFSGTENSLTIYVL